MKKKKRKNAPGAGRPPTGRTVRLEVRGTEETAARLSALATLAGKSRSAVIERLVQEAGA